MDYRIIIETEASGKKWYYVQKRFLGNLFWRYLTKVYDISMYANKIRWNTLEEAENHIQNEVNRKYTQAQKKIVKRDVYRDA